MSYLKSLNPLLSVVTKRDIHVKLERCLSSRSPNKMLVLCVLYLLAVSLYLKFLWSHQATRRIAKLEQDIKKMEKLEGNVGKLETGAATEVLGQVAGQVVRGRKGINIICRFIKMDPKANLKESLPLSDGEATKTLGGSGAFCFITWKWDTLPLPFGKSISSLLPLSHWIPSCRLLLETSSQSSVDAIDSWIAFTNTARSQNY